MNGECYRSQGDYRHFIIHWQPTGDSAQANKFYFYKGGKVTRNILELIRYHRDEGLVDPNKPRDQQFPVKFLYPIDTIVP